MTIDQDRNNNNHANAPNSATPPQMSELESLQLKCNTVTDDSLESTRRMIALCEDSTSAGIKTTTMLECQGEQLSRLEGGIDTMNAEMRQAEKHIGGLEKFCGLCAWPRKSHKIPSLDAKWKPPTTSQNGSNKISSHQNNNHSNSQQVNYIKRINEDAREVEMNENMGMVSSMIGNLKVMAQEMDSELGKQNSQIDRLTAKTTHVESRIGSANKRTEKLLGK